MHAMSDNTYNGWTNYETWAVAIWLDSDQSNYRYWCDQAQRRREQAPTCQQVLEGTWNPENAAKYNLADQLKEEINTGAPDVFQGAYSDLLSAALGEVNWDEIAAHYLENVREVHSPFGPVIFAYRRAQAIADGVLVDVSETASEAGIKYPTAVTEAVWRKYISVPEGVEAQDEQGRLWDILQMLRQTIVSDGRRETDRIDFRLLVRNNNHGPQTVTLKAICGAGDDAEPVITIMHPHED